jgi:hypothetical protein
MMYALFLLALRHAWRRGSVVVWQLLAGVFFGLALEWATIRQLNAYHYGRFLIMFGNVPLPIGIAWGTILYACRIYSNAMQIPPWSRPFLDGLLALNIDLSMDAIAIRLGFWNWGQGLHFQYFGVPWANFWAWFWVVFCFSAGLRLALHLPGWSGRWLAPALAFLIGMGGVLGTNALIVFVVPPGLRLPVIVMTLLGALLVVLAVWRGSRAKRKRKPIMAAAAGPSALVPLVFHLYFLTGGLISGAAFNPPFLLFVSLLMGAIATWLHGLPLRLKNILVA